MSSRRHYSAGSRKSKPIGPFHYFNLGRAAMEQENFKLARELFEKEVARADYQAEFHYWLALANFKLGDIEPARKHLTLAIENGMTRNDRELYAAKLAWLQTHRRAVGGYYSKPASCVDDRSRYVHHRCRHGQSCVPDKARYRLDPSTLAIPASFRFDTPATLISAARPTICRESSAAPSVSLFVFGVR